MKEWLQKNYWKVLGGQPPGGTNDIPLIELKDPSYIRKGSRGSKKIDLVAYKKGYFMLLELKPKPSNSDVRKLNEVVGESKWRAAFLKALKEKRIYDTLCISIELEPEYVESDKYYVKAVGWNNLGKLGPQDFVTFLLSHNRVEVVIGPKLNNTIRQLILG